MNKINCTAKIEEETIIIKNLIKDEMIIDLISDVDFTEIVTILSVLIDKSPEIELEIENETEISNEKTKLIISTLKDIFEKYNESVKSESIGDNDISL